MIQSWTNKAIIYTRIDFRNHREKPGLVRLEQVGQPGDLGHRLTSAGGLETVRRRYRVARHHHHCVSIMLDSQPYNTGGIVSQYHFCV